MCFFNKIYIPASLINIGNFAFVNCNNLNISVSLNNPNYSAESNILYNKNKTKLIATGKIVAEVTVPNTVTEILPLAFDGNYNLYKVYIKTNPTIGERAFASCQNLNSVYFYSYSTPIMGANSFSNNSFKLYTPYTSQSTYRNAFSSYTNNVDSIKVSINYISESTTLKTSQVFYGSNISNIYIPDRKGYDFKGWYSNNNFTGSTYKDGDKWEFTTNANLYAKWEAQEFDVTLDANGGIYDGVFTYKVKYDSSYDIPNTPLIYTLPTRPGYTFEGWYDRIDGGNKYINEQGKSTKLWDKNSDTTLYARWAVKSYEIQINNNGTITWLGASGLSNEKCYIEYGTVIDAINLIYIFKNSSQGFKEGYIFDHFENEGSSVNWSNIPDLGEDKKIVTITPKWVLESHTIYFNTQCDIIIDKIVVDYGTNIQLPINIERSGYLFKGWYTAQSEGEKITWKKMPDLTLKEQNNGSNILFAQYDIINFFIEYDLDGGTNHSDNPRSCTIKDVILLKEPTKQGAKFIGWYSDVDKTISIVLLKDTIEDIKIYADWSPITYRVEYYSSLGTGITESSNHVYNLGRTLTKNGFYYENHSLAGWSPSPNGSVKYKDLEVVINLTIIDNDVISLYAIWKLDYFFTIQTIFSDNSKLNVIQEFYLKPGETKTITAPEISGGTFSVWKNGPTNADRHWYYFSENKTITLSGRIYHSVTGENEITAVYEKNCIADGTLITLADGSQKAVELLTGNEQLLVWNLLTGQFDTAPILFIDSDQEQSYEVINLYFSDGTTVKVISEHGFWNIDLNKYVFLRNDASQYIGHWFNKQTTDANGNMTWAAVQLTDVVVANEVTTAWSPVTYGHLCYYVNGMLSMPGATTGLINIFEVNPDTMQYDQESMQADIAEYGLFTYEEFNKILPVPQEIFDAFGAQYFKVAIGKGLTSLEDIGRLIDDYSKFF